MNDPTQVRAQDALIPAAINALINGGIAYAGFKAEQAIPMTLDLISAEQHTVWGQGVTLAFALGIILSIVTAKIFAKHAVKADASLAPRVLRPVNRMIGPVGRLGSASISFADAPANAPEAGSNRSSRGRRAGSSISRAARSHGPVPRSASPNRRSTTTASPRARPRSNSPSPAS